MKFSNNVSYRVKTSWKGLLTLVIKLHDLFWMYDTYEGGNQKTTIIIKVRAIKQIFVIDPAN